jgi:NADPH2 dehydrogenase
MVKAQSTTEQPYHKYFPTMTLSRLFEPLTVGNIQLQHRMGLCPLTRYRVSDEHVPVDMIVEYYS